jgi:hypothetical protein
MAPVRDDVDPEVVITRDGSESIRDVSTPLDMTIEERCGRGALVQ